MRTHQEIDERSLMLHRFVADNPAQFAVARATLARWRARTDAAYQPYLERWEGLMGQGMEACLAVAVEESERADALRQNSPFAAITNQHEIVVIGSQSILGAVPDAPNFLLWSMEADMFPCSAPTSPI